MKHKILVILAVGLLTAPIAARAVMILPGQTAVFNFDLSAAAPGPPWENFWINWDVNGPWGSLESTVFGDLNGAGGVASGPVPGLFGKLGSVSTRPLLADGIFSISVTAFDGIDIVGVCTEAETSTGDRTDCIAGTLDSAVPEPGTLALIGLGLATLAFARRRELN